MAEIRPFQAYRPRAGLEARIAALPYDVYNSAEARAVVAQNPDSFLAIDRAETQFPEGTSPYEDKVYDKAAAMLRGKIADGTFVQDETPCYYVYAQTMNGRTQTGIVACASIDDYERQVIKKHENTRADKEEDRIRHIDACGAQTGPIFLAYRNAAAIDAVTAAVTAAPPFCDFVSAGEVRNRVWGIRDAAQIATIRQAFAGVESIYIADGHHRCASAVKVGLRRRQAAMAAGTYTGREPFNFFLSVLFPERELAILPYNRVVRDLNGQSAEQVLERISAHFEVERSDKAPAALHDTVQAMAGGDGQISHNAALASDKAVPMTAGGTAAAGGADTPVAPDRKGVFGLYLAGQWYRLTARAAIRSSDPVEGLDVSLLQNYVLGPVFGIGDPRTDKRIDFVGGIRGLGELERRAQTDMQAAFSLYPTSIQELFAVADAGRLMPPKSTWFEPKLLSGLFLHLI